MSTVTCATNALLRGCAAGLSARTVRLVRSRQALRDAMLAADRFVVASSFVADLCAVNGVLPQHIETIPPPFEGELLPAVRPRPARDRVLFAGRLVRDKGLRSLIESIARIPAAVRPELAVAGTPTRDSNPLPALAAAKNVRLQMLGRLGPGALNAEIDASTCVAVPSLWPEPFGLMGIEAQARGRPVVAFDVGGIHEWMGAAGVLVPRGDVAGFARGLRDVLDEDRWPVYAAAALRQSERYRLERHVGPLIEVLAGNANPLVERSVEGAGLDAVTLSSAS
jgi:glycosyltransferase involved in cell wall biosynthesis